MDQLDGIYIGTIQQIFSPKHPFNKTRYQYEYAVMTYIDNSAILVRHAFRADEFGNIDRFNDAVLSPGDKVLLCFADGNISRAIIIGALRNYKKPTDTKNGVHWLRRYNKFETSIDSKGGWTAKSDSGPNAQISVDKIILDDSKGQKIVFDKKKKTLTIEATELLTINIKKNASLTVGGNLTATVKGNSIISVTKNVTVTAKGNLTAKVDKNATIDVKGDVKAKVGSLDAKVDKDAKVTAGGKVEVKGAQIALNGESSGITTANSHQGVIDLITCVPVIASPTVKGDV